MLPSLASFAALIPDLGRKPSSGRYRPELDGLRCLAILIVMVWHVSLKVMRFTSDSGFTESIDNPKVALIPDGAVGVQLFFFLSGFVIYRAFVPMRQPVRECIQAFYRSRLIRIVPPYALVLLGSYLAIKVLGLTPEKASTFELIKTDLTSSLMASLFYLHGLLFTSPPKLNPPGWSLEIEMQFYLLAPFIILSYVSLRNATARVSMGCCVILMSVAVRVYMVCNYGEYGYFRWTLINYFAVFMLGIVMADLTWNAPARQPERTGRADLLFLGSAFALLAAGVFRHPQGWLEYGLADLAILGSIVGLYYGATLGRLANRLLSLPAISITGAACYSIYLTHVLLMHFTGLALFKTIRFGSYALDWVLGMLVLMPVALLGGFVFHVVVERLFIRLAARRPAAAPLASTVAHT